MTINFGNSFITIDKRWQAFITASMSKSLAVQYEDDTSFYTIFSVDSSIAYCTNIWKGTLVNAGTYSQAQNDLDKADFETNYKALANRPISPWSTATTGSVAPASTTAMMIGGKDGSANLFPIATHYNGTLVAEPHATAVARGRFANEANFSQPAYASTSGVTRTIIRGSTYTEQSSGVQRSIVSTSANDAAAGTGARTTMLRYFKNDGTGPFVEIITLNGTTPVNTVATDVRFIESLEVLTVGSNGTNVGTLNIKAAAAGGGATVGSINAGENRTFWGHHYIGTNKKGYLTRVVVSGTGSNFSLSLFAQKPLVANSADNQFIATIRFLANTTQIIDLYPYPMVFDGLTRITAYAAGDALTTGTIFLDLMCGDIEIT